MNGNLNLCSCCGQPLPADVLRWDNESRTFMCSAGTVRFTPRLARIFDVLFRRRERGAFDSWRDLADVIYASDPNGGPDDAENTISVAVVHMRAQLEPLGWTITRNLGRPKVGLRLVPFPARINT